MLKTNLRQEQIVKQEVTINLNVFMENNFFGEKDVFAIELRDYDLNRKLGRVRFWLNGKQYGDLRRKDEMEDVIEGLEMLGQEYGIELPKGASSLVPKAGRLLVTKHGKEILPFVAKMHFKTLDLIIN